MDQVEILETPIKSEKDKKEYRLIKHKNGLKALLVKTFAEIESSNQDDNHAAASLMVTVGSFDEPREIGGLAHFLEHMIFMGNEKYPEESGFNDYITANGGRRNAMTSDEFTLYFFDCFEEAFPEALDRFAHMFIHPLLSKNAMQRERDAVDSEYQMALSGEGARILGMLKHVFSETHHASQFDFGNLRTLKDEISDDELHKALLEFNRKYTADKMVLCIQSKRNLDEQQAMVAEKFSAIRISNEIDQPIPEFNFYKIVKPEFYTKIFHAKPRTGKKAMIISWLLPSQVSHYKCKPLTHVARIFDNTGEGGISSYLKDRNYVLSFAAHNDTEGISFNREFCITRLIIELTEYGFDNVEKILELIFSYLLMIKETPIEEHIRFFEQEQRSTEVNFKFHQESSSMSNVRNFSSNFIHYNDTDVLRTELVTEFDENAIKNVINHMNVMKFNILFLDDKYENYTKKEPFFQTEYEEFDFPEKYKSLWQDRKLNDAFFIPKPNPFEATNFDIKVNEDESTKYPVKILDTPSFEVWHKLDNKYKLPKVEIQIALIAPKHLNSPYNFLLFKLFDNMFTYHIRKKFSQAFNAELSGTFKISRRGCQFSFSGYNEKMEMFIDLYTNELKNIEQIVNESTFNNFKTEQKEEFISSLQQVRDLATEFIAKILVDSFHLDYDMYKLLDQITFEDVRKFVPKVLKKLKFKMLAQGNITKDETLRIVNILDKNFTYETYEEKVNFKRRGYQLPLGTQMIRIKSLMPNDDNSYIKNIYQIGQRTKKIHNMNKILKKIVDPKVYDILRSKHQLGYAVGAQIETFGGIHCLSIVVMSQEHKHKYSEVHDKIDDFVENIVKPAIDEITEEEFEKYKEARIKELQQDLLSLRQESSENWDEIELEFYTFDKYEIYAEVTKQLTLAEFKDYFNSFMSAGKQRKLCVQVIGSEKSNDTVANNENHELNVEFIADGYVDHNVITDIEAFQKNLYLYPTLDVLA